MPEGDTFVFKPIPVVNIFNIPGLDGELTLRKETAPALVPDKSVVIYSEVAKLSTLPLSKIISLSTDLPNDKSPLLAFFDTTLQNVEVYRRPYFLDVARPSGWYLETSFDIDSTMGEMHTFMKETLGMKSDKATVVMRLQLSDDVNALAWNVTPAIRAVQMEGMLTQMELELSSAVKLTDVGVRIIIFPQNRSPQAKPTVGLGLFGIFKLVIAQKHLDFSFDIIVVHQVASLYASLRGKIWDNAQGIEGLTLSNVTLAATLPMAGSFTPSFFVMAAFQLKDSETVFALSGTYSSNELSLSVYVEDLDWTVLDQIYHTITGQHLQKPQYTFSLKSGSISISTTGGFALEVIGLQVHEYKLESARLVISKEGIDLSGVYNASLKFDPWVLEQVSFHGAIGWKTSAFAFSLGGIIKNNNLVLLASVEFEKSNEGAWEWAFHGAAATTTDNTYGLAVTSANQQLSTGDMFPALKNTIADVQMAELSISIGSAHAPKHSKNKKGVTAGGVEVRAILSNADILSCLQALSKTPHQYQLELAAAYSAGDFVLHVNVLGLDTLYLTSDISISHFGLSLSKDGFIIEGGLFVTLGKDKLEWVLSMGLGKLGIAGYLKCQGAWNDPFGVGKNITLANLGAGVALMLPAAAPTVNFKGTLWVGKKYGNAEIQVSDDPTACFVDITVQNIDLGDFAWLLPPTVPSSVQQALIDHKDILKVPVFALCIAPKTMQLLSGRQVQAGMSFKCDCVLFDKNGHFSGLVSTSPPKIEYSAKVDPFDLGILKVQSASGAQQAEVSFKLSADNIYLRIDGAVTLLGLVASALIVYDQGKFTMDCELKLENVLDVKIQGYSIGASDLKTRHIADFYLHINITQDIFVWILQKLRDILSATLKESGRELIQAGLSAENFFKVLEQCSLLEREKLFHAALTKYIDKVADKKKHTPHNFGGWLEDRAIDYEILQLEESRVPLTIALAIGLTPALTALGKAVECLGELLVDVGDLIEKANIIPPFDVKSIDIQGTMSGLLNLPDHGQPMEFKIEIQLGGHTFPVHGYFNLDMGQMAGNVFKGLWEEIKKAT